jgi:branched-chain amino acid transport system ATP-binding protein
MSVALTCEELCVGYQRTTVARDIGISLGRNEILAVLGPNGAGKTTLLLTLAGFLAPTGGSITVDGKDVRTGSARRMNRAGVVLVPDSRALFTNLSTQQNIAIAARKGGTTVSGVLDLFPQLRTRAKVRAGMLSGGEQQMLAVARALVQGPRVLLIDEMSMGLAPIVVEQLMPLVRAVADETGTAIVLVEQHVHLALDVADTAMVLVHGDVSLAGKAAELRDDPGALEAAYLGTTGTTGSSDTTGTARKPEEPA